MPGTIWSEPGHHGETGPSGTQNQSTPPRPSPTASEHPDLFQAPEYVSPRKSLQCFKNILSILIHPVRENACLPQPVVPKMEARPSLRQVLRPGTELAPGHSLHRLVLRCRQPTPPGAPFPAASVQQALSFLEIHPSLAQASVAAGRKTGRQCLAGRRAHAPAGLQLRAALPVWSEPASASPGRVGVGFSTACTAHWFGNLQKVQRTQMGISFLPPTQTLLEGSRGALPGSALGAMQGAGGGWGADPGYNSAPELSGKEPFLSPAVASTPRVSRGVGVRCPMDHSHRGQQSSPLATRRKERRTLSLRPAAAGHKRSQGDLQGDLAPSLCVHVRESAHPTGRPLLCQQVRPGRLLLQPPKRV
ncbi:11-beta-hydroxysteroid dehydrogenase 1 isoform X1 [Erinaceus europaeus]|uniref:11-beta-hydroxysteroid dehydrogenase 1 isoform X1 n=1 Tax=Erinaceus europaeus TaxID=9365 RepID=A0ABM3WUX0_ERIEU|nr:11-beta-hydroxysteroid dehydrogenase 1 isoform X1 [Erinaceus europaeus]